MEYPALKAVSRIRNQVGGLKAMLNVLVTGTSGTNTGTQILSALLLCPERYRVVVTDIEKESYGAFKVPSSYVVPPARSEGYIPCLLDICRKEKIDVLIPGSEPELKVCSENRGCFEEVGIHLLINNAETIAVGMDKMRTIRFLKTYGFPYPKSLVLESGTTPEEMVEITAAELRFPLVLKPFVQSGGSSNLYLAQDKDELLFHLTLLRHRNDLQMMVQEYEGTPEEEYTIGVLSDDQGMAFSSFVLKRLINTSFTTKLKVPNRYKERITSDFLTISTGVSQGWVGEFSELKAFAEKVANALGSTGPLNLQCRKTGRAVVIFEINPRFSGTTSIRALCGHNDPDLLIRRRLFNEPPTEAPYRKGIVLRALENFFVEGVAPY